MQPSNEDIVLSVYQVGLDSSYKLEIVGLGMVYLKSSDYKGYVYK